VIGLAVERVVPEGKLVAEDEPTVADNAAETVDVVDEVLGPHDEVAASKAFPAGGALCTEQP